MVTAWDGQIAASIGSANIEALTKTPNPKPWGFGLGCRGPGVSDGT